MDNHLGNCQEHNNARMILMNEGCDFASRNTASHATTLEQPWKTALVINKNQHNPPTISLTLDIVFSVFTF